MFFEISAALCLSLGLVEEVRMTSFSDSIFFGWLFFRFSINWKPSIMGMLRSIKMISGKMSTLSVLEMERLLRNSRALLLLVFTYTLAAKWLASITFLLIKLSSSLSSSSMACLYLNCGSFLFIDEGRLKEIQRQLM